MDMIFLSVNLVGFYVIETRAIFFLHLTRYPIYMAEWLIFFYFALIL